MSRLPVVALAVLLGATACGGVPEAALVQDGPTLRTLADDGTLVVEGRVTNLSDHLVESASVEVTLHPAHGMAITLSQPLGGEAGIGPFESVEFRVETGVLADDSARVSISFLPLESP